jgi:hypothetical protein
MVNSAFGHKRKRACAAAATYRGRIGQAVFGPRPNLKSIGHRIDQWHSILTLTERSKGGVRNRLAEPGVQSSERLTAAVGPVKP